MGYIHVHDNSKSSQYSFALDFTTISCQTHCLLILVWITLYLRIFFIIQLVSIHEVSAWYH